MEGILLYGSVLRAVRTLHKVCTGPYPNRIVVPSINNNEPCYSYDLLACLALISSAFVCAVVHVTQKGYPI